MPCRMRRPHLRYGVIFMQEIKIGSLRLGEVTTTTGKRMLAAYRENGTRLLMDITASAIEDGQNGYLFDNKFIITVHWRGFSAEDKMQTAASGIKLRFLPTENGFWATVRFGTYRWGDVITLPGLMTSFNDLDAPFTDVVFVFVDSADGTPVAVRRLPLDDETGDFLKTRCKTAYDWFAASGYKQPKYRLLSDLCREITIPCEIEFITASSYYSGTSSSGEVKITSGLTRDISGHHVIIVEDIIDSGRTLSAVAEIIRKMSPLSLKIVTLLDKPERREVDLKADCSLFTIPDHFVIGYGLDLDEHYRNLPYIAEYKE